MKNRLWKPLALAAVASSVIFAGSEEVEPASSGDWVIYNNKFYGPEVSVTETEVEDVVWALRMLLKYADTGSEMSTTLEYLPPAEAMRAAANETDRKNAEIARAKLILREWESKL